MGNVNLEVVRHKTPCLGLTRFVLTANRVRSWQSLQLRQGSYISPCVSGHLHKFSDCSLCTSCFTVQTFCLHFARALCHVSCVILSIKVGSSLVRSRKIQGVLWILGICPLNSGLKVHKIIAPLSIFTICSLQISISTSTKLLIYIYGPG